MMIGEPDANSPRDVVTSNFLRDLPAVSRVLASPAVSAVRHLHPHEIVTLAVRAELAAARDAIRAGNPVPTVEQIAAAAAVRLDRDAAPRLRPVINATGIVLHTNLGRAPLHPTAARAAAEAGGGYCSLELDLGTGTRSSRQSAVEPGLCHITGAAAATVVNNCAAATVIVLRALAAGKEVIVSRGQLIEIGGGFRIPEIMAVSGATLREVGTTNITRIGDYGAAVGPNTGLLMRVHTSNYRVRGFTKSVGIEQLVELGRAHGIPVVDDAGSGAVVDLTPFGLPGEPVVADGIRAGADIVLFSGDKLLGGPQAGVIAGRTDLIRRIERDPFMRAVRADKMTLAALQTTLALYRDPAAAVREVPVLKMMTTPVAVLRERAERLAAKLRAGNLTVEVIDDVAYVGGGSLPDVALPTAVVAVTTADETAFAARLRTGTPAVVARVQGGRVLFDLRAVFPEQENALLAAILAAAQAPPA